MPRKKGETPPSSGGSETMRRNGEKPMLVRLSEEEHAAVMTAARLCKRPGSVWVRELVVAEARKILEKNLKSP